ncbi:MAG: hypothetical protein LUI10_10080 [Lachnospiraceae bacterium]|nr:hypothetical protein [Lachnospiraceae bacterium]
MLDFLMTVGIVLAVVLWVAGAITFNSLRRGWYGIIGLPSAYVFTCFALAVILCISQGPKGKEWLSVLLYLVVAVAVLVWIEIKCTTTAQHILAPIVAIMLAMGFCVRIVLAVLLHVEIANPAKEEQDSSLDNISFVDFTTSKGTYKLISIHGNYAWYTDPDGRDVKLTKEQYSKM